MVLINLIIGSSLFFLIIWLILHLHNHRLAVFWQNKGVRFINHQYPNLFSRIYHKINIIQMDTWIYNQMTDSEGFIGSTDEFNFQPILFLKDLQLIKSICVKDFDYFMNRRTIKNMEGIPMMNVFSKILFFQQDQKWKELRVKMSPTFTTGKIRRMYNIFNTSAQKLVAEVHKSLQLQQNQFHANDHLSNKNVIDLEPICGKYTIDVIASAAFGLETAIFENPNSLFSIMATKLQFLTIFGISIIFKFILIVLCPTLASKCKFVYADSQKVKNYFSNLIKSTIQIRKKQKGLCEDTREDFIQLMVEVQLENEKSSSKCNGSTNNNFQLTDELIISQCMQFFIAGLDSVQSGLEFGPYLLALYPEYQEKLCQSLQTCMELNNGELCYEVINGCEYLDKFLKECLRLFPPAQRIERKCGESYQIPGADILIPRGTPIIIPMYQIHHDPTYYQNPEIFDPERFSYENKSKRNPYAYFPFGIGPRNCIAYRFATFELKAALAHLVINFKFEPCSKTTIPMTFKVSTSLKPINGIWLHVEPRRVPRERYT